MIEDFLQALRLYREGVLNKYQLAALISDVAASTMAASLSLRNAILEEADDAALEVLTGEFVAHSEAIFATLRADQDRIDSLEGLVDHFLRGMKESQTRLEDLHRLDDF